MTCRWTGPEKGSGPRIADTHFPPSTSDFQSIDLALQNEHLSTNGTALAQQAVTVPKYSVRLYDGEGRAFLRKHYGTGGGAGLEHCVEYGFDATTGRLDAVTHGGGSLPQADFTWNHLASSHLPDVLTGPVHTADRDYEPYRDSLKTIANHDKAGTPANLATVRYGAAGATTDAVNGIGQRTQATFTGSAYNTAGRLGSYDYAYNANGELATGQRLNGSGTPLTGEGFGYDYDPIGNRLEASVDATPVAEYTPNQLNQYEEIDSTDREHDADGNLTDDGTLLYTWDAENRLIQVNLKSGNTLISKYRYDYASRRVLKQVYSDETGGTMGETVFIYDGWNLALEYPASSATVDGDEAPRRAYSWGNDLSGSRQGAGGVGGLLAIEERDGDHEGFYYPLYDGNGNVTQLVEPDGSGGTRIAAHYEYDPFGNLATTPTQQDQDSSGYHDVNPFRFSTKYFDGESGMYYYGYRFYDPVTGRWASRDPLEEAGGSNLYGFVDNDGVNQLDYLGLWVTIDENGIRISGGHTLEIDGKVEKRGGKITIEGEVRVKKCCSTTNKIAGGWNYGKPWIGHPIKGQVHPQEPGNVNHPNRNSPGGRGNRGSGGAIEMVKELALIVTQIQNIADAKRGELVCDALFADLDDSEKGKKCYCCVIFGRTDYMTRPPERPIGKSVFLSADLYEGACHDDFREGTWNWWQKHNGQPVKPNLSLDKKFHYWTRYISY